MADRSRNRGRPRRPQPSRLSDRAVVFHVPNQGQHLPEIETHRPFPLRKWVHLKITIDFDPDHGFIEVLQNGALVARAKVNGGHGVLEQAHFGMYAIPSLTTGKVCNDDLRITAART